MSEAVERKEKTNPLATERIEKLIIRFSIPAIISMVINAIYNIVDQIFIGWGVGQLGIGATNVSMPLVTICTATALLLGMGGASNFNLRLGAGDKESAGYIVGNVITYVLIFGAAIGAASLLFLEPLLGIFGATPQIMPYAISYTWIVAIGFPFMVFTTAACHMIRADGSPRFAMICMVSGAVFNLIFDPVFLFVFDMGIEGIALATTLGQVLSGGLAAFYLLKKYKSVKLERKHLNPKFGYLKVIAALGAASFFNQIAMTVVQIASNNVLRHYGAQSIYGEDIPISAVGAVAKVGIIFMAFTIGIAQGCQPIISFNYGARNYGRVKKTYLYALASATIVSVVCFLIFQIFPRQITAIFGTGDELFIQFSVNYLRIFMFMTFINGIQPVTSNFFTSIGKARVGIVVSLTRQVICLLPLMLVLPMFFGIDGYMYSGPIADAVAAMLAIFFAWREIRLITQQEKQMQLERPAIGQEEFT